MEWKTDKEFGEKVGKELKEKLETKLSDPPADWRNEKWEPEKK